MPTTHTIRRTGSAAASPAELRGLLASTAGFTSINPHRTADPRLRIEPFGPDSGVGAGFVFEGKGGKGTQTVAAVADDAVDYEIDMGSMGRSRQRIEFRAGDGATDVVWSQTLIAETLPQRVFTWFADLVLGGALETGIRNLAALDADADADEDRSAA
ncbi:hypothetical protein USB125703_01722 [Pseudoclavibacter triregionum]|nr:hypothetical protein USB125703_01722 [Pseudoclavibacter triregionum]